MATGRKRASPRARGGGGPPAVDVTPVDHAHAKQSSGPKLPAKPRHAKEQVLPEKPRSLLGDLPKKSPQSAKRLRTGDASKLLSPEEQAVGPTIWMDSTDQKVEAFNAWRDVGRELVRASQLQHAAMKMSRPADYLKKRDATTALLLHPEVTVSFDAALFSLTVARLLPTVQGILDPKQVYPDMFSVVAFPRKPPAPERPAIDEDCPGFAQFAEQRDLSGQIEAAAASLLAQQSTGKRKKAATVEELEKTASKKARKECLQTLKGEWAALRKAGQREFVAAEAQLLADHELAIAAHESLAPPTSTSFKVSLHDPALVQRLLRLPAAGFRAVEWHGPYGPVSELASVQSASLRYDVKDSALKLKCELCYVKQYQQDDE